MTRAPLSRDEFVAAALAFVDANGYEALTLRSLGELMDVSHTAIYRYFADREALLTAIADALVTEAMAVPPALDSPPRERITHRFRRIKTAFVAHPNIVLPASTTGGPRPVLVAWMREVVADLEGMGLSGERLVLAFRLLEGFCVGTTVFDLGGAPDHLELRRLRMRALAHPDFDAASLRADDVGASNEEAFELGLSVLLDACEAMAASAAA